MKNTLTQEDFKSPVFLEDWPSHGSHRPNGKLRLTRLSVDAGLFTKIKSAKIIDTQTGKTILKLKAKNLPFANLARKDIPDTMVVDKSFGLGTIHSQIYVMKSDLKCTRGKATTLETRMKKRTQKRYVVKTKFYD
jgi:hypothetical protein